jgi:hypothetical protein
MAVGIALVAPGGAARAATAAPTLPQRVAVIVFENRAYTDIVGDTGHAPYINGTILSEGLSAAPANTRCDYPAGDPKGAGSIACTSGMFQSFRNNRGFRAGGSAGDYAWMAMGTDANVKDTDFPNCVPGAAGCAPPSDPNGGVVGYTPGGDTSDPPYNVFKVAETGPATFQVYAEDYPGSASACATDQWSDGAADPHRFYARKHNPLLMVWDQSPDANVVPGITPSAAPGDTQCTTHMLDFPHNTPNTSVAQAVNFTGSEAFGTLTFIIPSLCHDMHNSNNACTGDTGVPADVGAVRGGDTWLRNNLDGIRRDVGAGGVVIVAWDESGGADGTGVVLPAPLFILPGVNASGAPGVLAACPAGGCTDTSAIYDDSSIIRSLLQVEGSGCGTLDDSVSYQGQGTNTARSYCAAATPLPLALAR